jgi:hypothetical protein
VHNLLLTLSTHILDDVHSLIGLCSFAHSILLSFIHFYGLNDHGLNVLCLMCK